MQDLNEAMAASEFASLAAFARAVLARAHSDDPSCINLTVVADVDAGEITVQGSFFDHVEDRIGGFGV